MAVTFTATITDGAGGNGGGASGALRRIADGITPEKVARTAAHGMVYEFLPDVFESNLYGWDPVLRGGQPLRRGPRTSSSIVSAFVYSVSGAVASIRNVFKYGHIHNDGATIRAKNAKYLRFKIGDRWSRKKEVVIPPRRFAYWSQQARDFCVKRVNEMIRRAREGKS